MSKNWTKEHEKLFVEWADKALCYKWLHSKSNIKYNNLNTMYTIPVIIMSTLTGTANFAQEKFPENMKSYVPIAIGLVNIAAGIITTVQQFLGISELNEAYRVAALSWDKFYRKIKVELSKHPEERASVEVFLKSSADEFDRLMEISPMINSSITKEFQKTFEGKVKTDRTGKELLTEKQKAFRSLKKPEICDSLETTFNSIYKSPDENKDYLNLDSRIEELMSKKKNLVEKYNEIQKYIVEFYSEYTRLPSEEEITENFMRDSGKNIDKTIIVDFIFKYGIKNDESVNFEDNNPNEFMNENGLINEKINLEVK